jgi:L-lactate dehydrogenase complex protein LldG
MSDRSKSAILARLRAAAHPFTDVPPIAQRRPMVDVGSQPLIDLFAERAQAVGAHVSRPSSEAEAISLILRLIGDETRVLTWEFAHIPLSGLAPALAARGITVAPPRSGDVRIGITGADAALAATGSIVVCARRGQHRVVSLLPDVHIAVVQAARILPHLEAWLAQQSADLKAFRAVGNHIIITGPSRTADIGMELVMGAHGPRELHLVLMGG